MESFDFNWLNNDEDIMDSLIGIASLPDEQIKEATSNTSVGSNIINYLLEETQPNHPNNNFALNQGIPQPNHKEEELNFVLENTTNNPSLPFNVTQGKDNFVTFTPNSSTKTTTTTKKQSTAKKPKFKEPIFVTESPQSFSQKNKKSAANSHSSAEDNSDNDMVDVPVSSSNLKQMTSKERRQLRNKISARNFRVRRKEYITQLEEKVDEYEQTIEQLRRENEQLKQANQQLLKQMHQPVTPPSSSLSSIDASSSSASEGNHSPEAPPPMFHFQLSDFYDVNLFDQQQQQQQQQQPMNASNLFYLNHAVMPDFDISEVLGEKGKPATNEEIERQISREMLHENPLMAAALMSVVLRHTISLEYVQSLAEELNMELVTRSKSKNNSEEEDNTTVLGDEVDNLKSHLDRLQIEDDKANNKPLEKDEELEYYEYTRDLLTNHFPYYAYQRALGKSHDEVVTACKKCHDDPNSPCMVKKAKKLEKKKAKEAKKAAAASDSSSNNGSLQTLQAYCRVAGTLLRHPQRMTRVRGVLKESIDFKDSNKSLANIEQNYKRLINPTENRRITTSSH